MAAVATEKVLRVRHWNDTLFSFATSRSPNLRFENGHFLMIGLPVEEMQGAIRDCRKPVIARVKGYAIGGGNVLVTVCDSPSRRRTRASGRWDPRWARSIRVGAPPVSRASSGIRGRVKFGTCAGAIPRGTR